MESSGKMNKPSAKRENEKGQIQMGKREEKRTKCPTLGGDIEIDNDIEARRRLAFIHCVVAGKDIYKEQRDTYIYIYIYFYSQSDSPLTKSGAEQRWREQELKTLSQR